MQDTIEHRVVRARGVWQGTVIYAYQFKLQTLVDPQRGVAAIINGKWQHNSRHGHHLLNAPPIFRKRLVLPCKTVAVS